MEKSNLTAEMLSLVKNLVQSEVEQAELNSILHATEVSIQRLTLKPGEVVAVTIKSDQIGQADIQGLNKRLGLLFPNNRALIMALDTTGDIRFGIVSPSEPTYTDPNAANFCNDCGCGKKEAFEANNK